MDLEIGSVVRVKRRVGCRVDGVVAGIGARWVLLHALFDLQIDGLCAVRRRDIAKVRVESSGDGVTERSLRHRGAFPAPVTDIGLDNTGDVLEGLGARGIVTVHPERRDPGVCFLGVVGAVDRTRKRFELLELSPTATWYTTATVWHFGDVSRVQVLTGYEEALSELAGPPPPIRSHG